MTTTDPQTHSLADRLRERIRRDGPISFHDWMSAALYDEHEGYYCRRDIVRRGRLGDYRTAPERTSLFAATFARYFAKLFRELGSPERWTIIEVGAGFGEFAAGVLQTLQSRYRSVFAATRYLIDEHTEDGRDRAAANLTGFESVYEFCRSSERNLKFPVGIIFSNELIDAFPVYRIVKSGGILRSQSVGLDAQAEFIWIEQDLEAAVAQYCGRANIQLAEGQITEINLGADRFIAHAAELIDDGFIITVDYGDEREALLTDPHRRQGTLRAAYRHQISSDVLQQPGRRDLTATIDWTQLREAGEKAGLSVVSHQGLDRFLMAEGLLDELEEVARDVTEAERAQLCVGAREMIMPGGMASSFQVLVQRKGPLEVLVS
ncbi:MAG TPA: SAM-dependent methyltransferase [Pyrinomonadaceae bacterium]|nr:SAM-dependent methyltransferase [Pyrinomonadaceae bacterium]